MKVHELIERLLKLPQDADVECDVDSLDGFTFDVEDVSLAKCNGVSTVALRLGDG